MNTEDVLEWFVVLLCILVFLAGVGAVIFTILTIIEAILHDIL